LLDLDSEIGNHLDKFDIFSHDVHVVLLVDLLLLFQSLFQRVLGVIEVAFLVLVLLLDIWINFDVLHLLVLDEVVKVLINHSLQLIEVINVLSDPVNSVLEALDFNIISSNLCSVFLDQLLHVLLTSSQVINNITKICVNLVKLSQVFVHVVGLFLQSSDLHSSWGNVSLELLDFVIKYELELLKLLSLLL
jgi:hypothetical protein